jgi:hypothetical protein
MRAMKKYDHKKDFTRLEKETAILLKLIAEELNRRSVAYHAESINGGHVGTFMYVKTDLKQVLASMMYEQDSTEEQVFATIEKLISKAKRAGGSR